MVVIIYCRAIVVQENHMASTRQNMGKITVVKKFRKWYPPDIEDVQEPFCGSRRKNLVPLSQTHPEIADEWLYRKNCGWTPDDFSAGSNVRAYWECPNCLGEYRALVNNRKNGNACPYCASAIVCDNTSLLVNFPEVAKEWHPSKNKKYKIEDFFSGSAIQVWWLCSKCNHSWKTAAKERTRRQFGCPACLETRREYARLHPKPRVIKPLVLSETTESNSKWYQREGNKNFVSLYKFNKALANQWHPTKNGKVTAKDIAQRSEFKAWWKCSKGPDHEWQARVATRSHYANAKCPFCSNLKLSATNVLSVKAPAVAKEWHPTKNGELEPNQVIAGGSEKYWFQCSKDKGHEWEAQIGTRINGAKCPFCSHNRVSNINCLKEHFPQIANQLHPTKNSNVAPSQIAVNSHKKFWWVCPEGPDHLWLASASSRTTGRGCPFCAGKQRSITNCLATLNPETAAQWHPARNKNMTPFTVSPFSREVAWWICSKGHKWQQPIYLRVNAKTFCRECLGKKPVKLDSSRNG
jgi:hypothetical protein